MMLAPHNACAGLSGVEEILFDLICALGQLGFGAVSSSASYPTDVMTIFGFVSINESVLFGVCMPYLPGSICQGTCNSEFITSLGDASRRISGSHHMPLLSLFLSSGFGATFQQPEMTRTDWGHHLQVAKPGHSASKWWVTRHGHSPGGHLVTDVTRRRSGLVPGWPYEGDLLQLRHLQAG